MAKLTANMLCGLQDHAYCPCCNKHKDSLRMWEAERERLVQENKAALATNDDLLAETNSNSAALKAAQAASEAEKKKHSAIESELQADLVSMQQQLLETQKHLDKAQQCSFMDRKMVSELQGEKQRLIGAKARLMVESTDLLASLSSLRKERAALLLELTAARVQSDRFIAENKSISNSLKALEGAFERLQKEIGGRDQIIQELQSSLTNQREEGDKITAANEKLQRDMEDMDQVNKELQASLKTVGEERDKIVAENERLQNDLATLMEESKKRVQAPRALVEQVQKLNATVASMKKEKSILLAEVAELMERAHEAEDTVSELESSVGRLEVQEELNRNLTAEMAKLRGALHKAGFVEAENKQLKQLVEILEHRVEDYRGDVQMLLASQTQMEESIRMLQDDNFDEDINALCHGCFLSLREKGEPCEEHSLPHEDCAEDA